MKIWCENSDSTQKPGKKTVLVLNNMLMIIIISTERGGNNVEQAMVQYGSQPAPNVHGHYSLAILNGYTTHGMNLQPACTASLKSHCQSVVHTTTFSVQCITCTLH